MYDQSKTGDNCEFYYGQGMFHHLKANAPGAASSWVVARSKACGDGDWVDGESGRRPSSGCGVAYMFVLIYVFIDRSGESLDCCHIPMD